MAGQGYGDRFLRCVMPDAGCVVLALKLNVLQRLCHSAVRRYNLPGPPVLHIEEC